MKLKTVLLYNWQTNTTCDTEPIPQKLSGMVGTLINERQIFCGGEAIVVQSKCYELIDFSWVEVSYIAK